MRGLHQPPPDSGPLIPGTPNQPAHFSSTSARTSAPPPPTSNIQASVEYLQAQNTALHNSMDSFQAQMQTQFNSFQQSVLDAILRLQPPSSSPQPPTPTHTTIPQLSFGSLVPISTKWTCLGLSNPPSPTLNSALTTSSVTTSIPQHQQLSSPIHNTSIYSTVTSIPHHFHSHQDPTFPQFHTHPYNSFSHPTIPYPYRPPKVDLPRFTGEDVVGWLSMAERYIRTQHIPAHERITIIASHFGPGPSVWTNSFEQRHPTASWEQFVRALLEHFGSGNSSDFKVALSHLQHTRSVDDYILAFTKL